MKSDDSRREQWQNAAKNRAVLIPLIFGSVVLHLLILWGVMRFPTPPGRRRKSQPKFN